MRLKTFEDIFLLVRCASPAQTGRMTEKPFLQRWFDDPGRPLSNPRCRRSTGVPPRSAGSSSYRWIIVSASASVLVWIAWDSRIGAYAGLSVNILGQVLGDLLVAGLALGRMFSWRSARERQGIDRDPGSGTRGEVTVQIIVIRDGNVDGSRNDVRAAFAMRDQFRHPDAPFSIVLPSQVVTAAWREVEDDGSSRVK